MNGLSRAFAIFAAIATLCIAAANGPSAQTVGASPAYDAAMVQILEHSARAHREYAAKLQGQAAQYRELELNARKYAAAASNAGDRAGWTKDADKHATLAEKLAAEAATEIRRAEEEEARLLAARQSISETQAKAAAEAAKFKKDLDAARARNKAEADADANNPNKGVSVDDIMGIWKSASDDEPFIIVQRGTNPAASEPHQLEAHTPRRIWQGEFHADPAPGKPLMTFNYVPKAEEISSQIPAWARERIAGELKWTLEISKSGTCGTPSLDMDFYPGEVTWNETSRAVKITGKGNARRLSLSLADTDIRFYSYGTTELFLRPAGLELGSSKAPNTTTALTRVSASASNNPVNAQRQHVSGDDPLTFDPNLATLDGLIKGERFKIDVALPPEIAAKEGPQIVVKIEASSGSSTSVELQRGPMRKGRSVVYTLVDPITIADRHDVTEEDRDPPLLSLNYILGYQGERISLDVENGELVTFRYGETVQTIPVFNSWVQRRINQHQEAIERLRVVLGMIVADGTKTRLQRNAATRRLSMIRNYERIMESATIHDFIRYRVGEAYFNPHNGLINLSEDQWQANLELMSPSQGGSPSLLSDAQRDGSRHSSGTFKGVAWNHRYEKVLIENTVVNARLEYRETALREIPLALTFAMYEIVGGMSGFGDVYTLATGEDIFGRRVSEWERLSAAIGIAESFTLTLTLPHVMTPPSLKGLGSSQLSGRAMRAGARARLKQHVHTANATISRKIEAAMKGMNPAQRQAFAVGDLEDGTLAPSSEPLSCSSRSSKKGASNVSAANPQGLGDGALEGYERDPAKVQAVYGGNAKYAYPGQTALFRRQFLPVCQCASIRNAMVKAGLDPMSDLAMLGLMVKKRIIVPGKDLPLVNGYSDKHLVALLEVLGAEVKVIKARRGKRVFSLEQMDRLMKEGWTLRDVLQSKEADDTTMHAVQLEQVQRNSKGEITDVVWYDPAFGDFITAPVCDYLKDIAGRGQAAILYKWREGGGSGSVSGDLPEARSNQQNPKGWRENNDKVERLTPRGETISERESKRIERESRALGRKIENMFPNGDFPHLNVLSRENLKRIFAEGVWQPPADGRASFSVEGVGTLRGETVAIRLKPGHDVIDWIDDGNGTGKIPIFKYGTQPQKLPNGKMGNTYIPVEYLEWIDVDHMTWQSFPKPGEARGTNDGLLVNDLEGLGD